MLKKYGSCEALLSLNMDPKLAFILILCMASCKVNTISTTTNLKTSFQVGEYGSYGAGIRYQLKKTEKLNLRLDYG